MYQFEGILLALKKNLKHPECSLVLRNIILGVGVEYIISYYYNRIFFLKFSDYKRKRYIYKRSKLYYLRNQRTKSSRVK